MTPDVFASLAGFNIHISHASAVRSWYIELKVSAFSHHSVCMGPCRARICTHTHAHMYVYFASCNWSLRKKVFIYQNVILYVRVCWTIWQYASKTKVVFYFESFCFSFSCRCALPLPLLPLFIIISFFCIWLLTRLEFCFLYIIYFLYICMHMYVFIYHWVLFLFLSLL